MTPELPPISKKTGRFLQGAIGGSFDADRIPGGFWNNLKNWLHVQLCNASSPLIVMALVEIGRITNGRLGG